jgi:DNA-binding response OmpR family regulator
VSRKILVIEDSPDIADLLALHLGDEGYQVELDQDGRTGLRKALEQSYDLVILDLMLPEVDGLEICRQLRAAPSYTPILMLTARSTEIDRVVGLELGADDYLTKPFSIRELVARVKALFRRVEAFTSQMPSNPSAVIRMGDLVIDPERRKVQIGDRPIELTAKEFDLLLHFARHPGRVYSRAQLLDLVWGYGHDGYEHTVNSHIILLRAKIERNPARPRYLLTVWGVGYKFFEAEEPQRSA